MELKFLCPQWGHEHLDAEAFMSKVKEAGYDGVDTWVPESTMFCLEAHPGMFLKSHSGIQIDAGLI